METEITGREIQEAEQRIRPFIHRTPVLTSTGINEMIGAQLFFKCENFQKAGAFKIRGACNAVFALADEEAERGVATHSSGNHAAALALAARWRGIRAHVVMPENAALVKKAAALCYGAEIVFCKPTLEAREEVLSRIVEGTGATFIPPYNDLRVMAGQGTAALELVEEIPELDAILAPVGGGGLISGTAIAVFSVSPSTAVIGAEPQNADDAYRSFQSGRIIPVENPNTLADGLRTSLGSLTFPVIRQHVKQIITVTEEDIVNAMRCIWERMKIIVEPSGAVPLGAVFSKAEEMSGKRIGLILSGGNVDLGHLPWVR